MSETYKDINGNEVSLDKLCRTEPAWAANVIRTLKDTKAEHQAQLRLLAGAVLDIDDQWDWETLLLTEDQVGKFQVACRLAREIEGGDK